MTDVMNMPFFLTRVKGQFISTTELIFKIVKVDSRLIDLHNIIYNMLSTDTQPLPGYTALCLDNHIGQLVK